MEEKKEELKYLKVQKNSLVIHKQLRMFTNIYKAIIQQGKGECDNRYGVDIFSSIFNLFLFHNIISKCLKL